MIQCEIYSGHRFLRRDFRTASGSLREKQILQLIFKRGHQPVFVWELALSPSLGEMPNDILKEIGTLLGNIEQARSSMISRALSFAKASLAGHSFSVHRDALKLSIINVPIGSEDQAGQVQHGVAKLKGDPTNIEKLIELTRSTTHPIIVDFNGSLDDKSWKDFAESCRAEALLYIEQPQHPSQPALLSNIGFPVYADESCQLWAINELRRQGYKGVVLKLMRYNFGDLKRMIEISRSVQMQSVLGRMVGDYIEEWHLRQFSAAASINVSNWQDTRELSSFDVVPDWVVSLNTTPPWEEMATYVCATYTHVLTIPTALE